jgi:hypothetical protein
MSKKKIDIIDLVTERVKTQSLNRQKKKNISITFGLQMYYCLYGRETEGSGLLISTPTVRHSTELAPCASGHLNLSPKDPT